LLYGSDSILQLRQRKDMNSFPVATVSYIETKRAAGHPLLVGTTAGIGAAITGVVVASALQGTGNDGEAYGTAMVAFFLPVIGFVGGGIAELTRSSDTFEINGDSSKWKMARKQILQKE
jgi:hypothetical protein